jgi:hypothetical protein
MRCCTLGRLTGSDPLAGLLSTPQAVVSERHQPIRQYREGLLAWFTDSAPYPDGSVLVVMALTKSPSMADDRVVMANRTAPRQKFQWNYPGSMLSFASASPIKRITAGVKVRR